MEKCTNVQSKPNISKLVNRPMGGMMVKDSRVL
jgi:hypothetical protein